MTVVQGEEGSKESGSSRAGIRIRNLRQLIRMSPGKIAFAGAILSVGSIVVIVLAPILAPGDPNREFHLLLPPTSTHLFGTDFLGRDIFALTLYGGKIPFLVGGLSTLICAVVGVTLGLVFGYRGGSSEKVMTLIMDSL